MSIIIGGGSGNQISIAGSAGTAGQVITSDGTNASWGIGSFSGLNARAYTTPGTFTVGTDCPSAITQIKIIACGGGGIGANGTPGNTPSPFQNNGGGGGGGATANIFYRSVSSGQVYTITIGGAAGNTTIAYPGPTVLYTCNAGGNGSTQTPGSAGAISPLAFPLSYKGGAGGGGSGGYPVPTSPQTGYWVGGNGGPGGTNQLLASISGYASGGAGGGGGSSGSTGGPGSTVPGAYGSGGGGGGGGPNDYSYGAGSGAAGQPGVCWIEW